MSFDKWYVKKVTNNFGILQEIYNIGIYLMILIGKTRDLLSCYNWYDNIF